jgi:hypothetical protein
MAVVTRAGFAKRVLNALDAPVSQRNLNAMVAWETAEGTTAKFNALATTKRMPGSWSFNSVGVQNFPDLPTGVEATFLTMLEDGHGYEPIVARLRSSAPAKSTLAAVEASAWGTGGLALRVLPQVKRDFDQYGNRPIGQ